MKKYISLSVMMGFVLLFTGCVRLDTQIVVKPSGKIDVTTLYDMSQMKNFANVLRQNMDDFNCEHSTNAHPTRPMSCEDLPDGNIRMIWKDIDGSQFNAFQVTHKDPIESQYSFDIKAFMNHFKQPQQDQKNIIRNTGGSISLKVFMPGVTTRETEHLKTLDALSINPYGYEKFIITSSDLATRVELNGTIKRDGMIDMEISFQKNQPLQQNTFDCTLLEKSSYIKPINCEKENNSTLVGVWEKFNGGNFETLKISYENLFITQYEINVENLIKNINPNRESYKEFIQNLHQSKGEYFINLEIPGSPILTQDFVYSDGLVKIDLVKYYLYKDTPLIIKATEYNLFMLLFVTALMLAILLGGVLILLKKQRGEEYYTTIKNRFFIAIGSLVIVGIGCFGYQTYLQQTTHLINTYKKEIQLVEQSQGGIVAPIAEVAPVAPLVEAPSAAPTEEYEEAPSAAPTEEYEAAPAAETPVFSKKKFVHEE
jgi:hypothetical protein